ncbi:MAG: 16S rRNA processing protein RimM [Chrysiogenales bacterium]|nr:MAG: 16S rRNA processing protein RimM [Chrysiogenales bacterium]
MTPDDLVRIAVITGVHGLTGRLKIAVTTDFPERFQADRSVIIKTGDNYGTYKILEFVDHGKRAALLRLEGIGDRNAAIAFRGGELFIEIAETERTRSLLDEESYYYYDIIGCVVFRDGRECGTVADILEAGAGEILVITDGRGERYMVPFVESMVDTSEIRSRRLNIDPVEGLFEIQDRDTVP